MPEEKSVQAAKVRGGDDKTSYSAPSVSLPKGGGAIKGIGEKFGVNPVNGTATMTVPIFTTPGRSGFYPRLSIGYDSGAGNGPFGFGWHLSVPSITRKTDKGLPHYFDAEESDVFILSDAEDLMPVLGLQGSQWSPVPVPDRTWNGQAYSIKRYRPRIEGLFARIERWQRKSDGDLHWRAITKENVTSIYGLDPTCRIADPSDSTHVFKWLLEATLDDKGNIVVYEYKPEDATGVDLAAANERNRQNGNAPYTNAHIKRIYYGNTTPYNPTTATAWPSAWNFEVVFDYGEHNLGNPAPTEDPSLVWSTRADPFSTFRSTFDIRTYRLCLRVLMFHHFPAGQNGEAGYDGLVRSTDFSYDQPNPQSRLLGNPIATQLVSLTQTGYALDATGSSYDRKCFPPLEFTYSQAEIDPTVRTVEPESLENLPIGADGSSYQWLDLDGEGLSGILTQQTGAMFYKRNLSPLNTTTENGAIQTLARFGALELVGSQPAPINAGTKSQFMDLAADGRQDMVNLDGPMRGYYERTECPGWESLNTFESFPNLDTHDPNLKFIDINGDGLTDILVSEDSVMAWYQSLGCEGFGPRQFATKPFDEEKGAALVFNDPTQSIFLADMTGDGLSDIVRIRNGEVCYWPNCGYGRFGAKVTMDNSPIFDTPDMFDPRRIRLADIDGCGNADILYLAPRGVAIYHNQAGNSCSAEVLLPDVPPINNVASMSTVNLLGNGLTCLVWSSPLPSAAGRQMQYIDLMGRKKPYLLIGIKNNLGAETRVRYASSTKFYVQDRAAGTPWVTKLAFPVYVVERAEVFDYIGRTRLVTTYRYRHGYFDGVEREFRGFGYVEQRDVDSFGNSASLFTQQTDPEADTLNLPPVVTKTWYHTGAWPNAETIIQHMAHEYFSTSSEGALLPDTILPTDVFVPDPSQPAGQRIAHWLSGEEQREAVRALKGSILRREIYADDGTAKAGVPFSVSERNYTVECFQPQGDNLYAVFFTHARETIDYHHERNPADPRVTHSVVLQADPFGDVLQSISLAYGRNLNSPGVQLAPDPIPGAPPDLSTDASTFAQPEQATALITLTENSFTGAIDDSSAYRMPMASETCTYELTRPARPDDSVVYSFDDLQSLVAAAVEIAYEAVPDPTATQIRLVEDVRTLFLKDDLSGSMPLNQMDSLGLVYETYKLAMTGNLAQRIFATNNTNPNKPVNAAALNAIISGVGSVDANGAFTNSGGGYVNSQDDSNWWIPSGQTMYSPVPQNPPNPFIQDATFAAANFYLPQAHCDPFDQYTRLTYDSYNLLLQQTQDALGNTITAQNDYRVLQPFLVTDPNQNQTEVRFDTLGLVVGTAVEGKVSTAGVTESGDAFATFTVDLAPSVIQGFIDSPNPVSLAAGLLGTATTRVVYDLHRFRQTSLSNPNDPTQWEPVFAATIVRETHGSTSSKMQVNFSYSDGFGHEIQKKAQAEPGPLDLTDPTSPVKNPRWVGSGWTILNNKGKPIRQYEPFFSATQDFEFANKVGVTSTLFYDALERVVATLHPNQTWEKVVFDPWRQSTWDVNDTVLMDPTTDPDVGDLFSLLPVSDCLPTWYQLRTGATAGTIWPDPEALQAQQDAAAEAAAHNDTPTTALFDVLGRQFLSVAHNRYQKNGATVDQFYQSCTELDIEGNQLSVTDALGRLVMRYDYDMLKNRLHQASMEAGERWILNNVVGKSICAWDSRGFMRTMSYDQLQRPIALNVADNTSKSILAEKTIYGDSNPGGPTTPEQTNQRGKVYQAYDAAGLVTNLGLSPVTNQNEGYDFKGNLLRSNRALLTGNAYQAPVDWNQDLPTGEVFTGSSSLDALNRVIQQIAPHSNQQAPSLNITQPSYNEANFLETVDVWLQQTAEPDDLLDPTTATLHAVTNIDYNAKGQRITIDYGILDANGNSNVNTAYEYDPETFRLVSLTTTSTSDGTLFQDLLYYYDPVGNITHIQDDAQDTIYFKNKKVEPSADYLYDAIYRLIKATGREHLGQTGGVPNAPTPQSYNDWPNINLPHPNDGNAMGTYIENFGYDPVGNIQQSQHIGSSPANPGWTRTYAYTEASLLEPSRVSNRLSTTTVGGTTETYSTAGNGYDAHGNMLQMPQLQAMQWDFNDQMQMTRRQAVNTGDTDGTQRQGEQTYYVYDLSGQRVRKVTESSDDVKMKERIYLGGFEIYREYTGANGGLERQTLHVMDDKQRVALIETRNNVDDGTSPQLIRFQFGNHLGSACLELNDQGQVISYEEYYPYGSTSYQGVNQSISSAAKRYRYTGKERDEESGLYYHGARYCAPWLGRWTKCDPQGMVDGPNLYAYARGNPLAYSDPTGTECDPSSQCCVDQTASVSNGKQSSDGTLESRSAEMASGAASSTITNNPPGFTLEVPNNFDNSKIKAYKERITNPRDRGVGIRSRLPGERSATRGLRAENRTARNEFNDSLPPSDRALKGVRDIDERVELQNIIRGDAAPGANVVRPQDYRSLPVSLNRSQGSANRAVIQRQVSNGAPVDTPAGGVTRTNEIGNLSNTGGFRTAMRYGGYALLGAATAYSAYSFSQDVSKGNWGDAALSGSSFAGGALVLGGSAAGSGTLVSAGVIVGAPAAVIGAGLLGVQAGTYINNNTRISETAASAGSWAEAKTGSTLAGATAAAGTAVITAPYYGTQAAIGALGNAGSWLGQQAYELLH